MDAWTPAAGPRGPVGRAGLDDEVQRDREAELVDERRSRPAEQPSSDQRHDSSHQHGAAEVIPDDGPCLPSDSVDERIDMVPWKKVSGFAAMDVPRDAVRTAITRRSRIC